MWMQLATLQQKTSWLNRERKEWLAVLVVIAAVAYALGYGNYQAAQGEIRDISHQATAAKKQASTAATSLKAAVDACNHNLDAAIANDADAINNCPPVPPIVKSIIKRQ